MKTHEHALISLGFGACISLISVGNLVSNPGIYLAAVLGGECIDFIDHPLYQLVYRRNEVHVKESRKILKQKGLIAAIRYLNQVEDCRGFNGLLLHNIYSFIILLVLTFLVFWLAPDEIYIQVFFSALILHMLTDIQGDLRILGHINNWLWVLPEKIRLQSWGELIQTSPCFLIFKRGLGRVNEGKSISTGPL
jgi:hypothetical protein